MNVTKDLTGELLNQRTIETLCNIPFVKTRLIKQLDVKDIINRLTELLTKDVDFVHRFKIKNLEFGMIPDLENMTSGEYADLTKYIGEWNSMHKAMAVLFRPIKERQGDKYDVVEYEGSSEYSELMDFMPLGVAMGAMVFFWSLTNDLINATRHSMMKEMTEEILQCQPNSGKSGGGINTSTHSLKDSLETLIGFPDLELTNASRI